MKLLTVLAFVLVAGAFVGCKYFRGQIVDGPGMEREVDSLETDSVPLADDGKHTVDYIRQRVDGMYACYKNPKYDESGFRLMTRGNLDSAYCSMVTMISCSTTIIGPTHKMITISLMRWAG